MNARSGADVTIGVTRCSRLGDYVAAVEQAGATVRVLEVDERPAEVLRHVHGVLLTGGADIDPSLYGEVPHPSVVAAEPGRDAFELDLARGAIESDLPMLAICRGVQVLNVAAGGTLVQDIPSALPSALPHAVPEPLGQPCHEVTVRPESRLSQVLGSRMDATCSCLVNSRHHQAIAQVADGFRVSAEASDGVIEAIEKPNARFCLGVQWHPENFWRTGEFNALFNGLVTAARQSRPTS